MAFIETNNDDPGGPAMFGPLGLPVDWAAVADLECPYCGEPLESFAHVGRWICPCGFKVSATLLDQIKKFTKFGRYSGPGICRGYGFGLKNYDNETPF